MLFLHSSETAVEPPLSWSSSWGAYLGLIVGVPVAALICPLHLVPASTTVDKAESHSSCGMPSMGKDRKSVV